MWRPCREVVPLYVPEAHRGGGVCREACRRLGFGWPKSQIGANLSRRI